MSNMFNCPHCDKEFVTQNGLDTHLGRFHQDDQEAQLDVEAALELGELGEPEPFEEAKNVTIGAMRAQLDTARAEIAELRAMVQAQDVALKGIADIASVFKN